MSVLDVLLWIGDHGGEHVEIVSVGFSLVDNPKLIEAIRTMAEKVGIEISNYAIGANFLQETEDAYHREIERVMREVDTAHHLSVKLMRHDVAWCQMSETNIVQFEEDLETMADACRKVADYATQYGITTSVENHDYFVQASDRIHRLLGVANRDNFKTTLDVGNFLCVDEKSSCSG